MNLTLDQIDALKEVINIGVGRAAGELHELLLAHISLQVPSLTIVSVQEFPQEVQGLSRERLATVRLGFTGSFDGSAALMFPPDSASKLVTVLTGEEEDTPDLDAVRAGTLSEVGNIVINGVMGSISNVLEQRLNFSLPTYGEESIENLLFPDHPASPPAVLLARTCFSIASLRIEGSIILLFEVDSFDALLAAIDAIDEESETHFD